MAESIGFIPYSPKPRIESLLSSAPIVSLRNFYCITRNNEKGKTQNCRMIRVGGSCAAHILRYEGSPCVPKNALTKREKYDRMTLVGFEPTESVFSRVGDV